MATLGRIKPRNFDSTGDFSANSMNVAGNVTAGNLKTNNLLYSNGTAYVFTTNAAGSNTQIQFNDANSFAGSANLTFNKTNNTLAVTNIVATDITANGTINLGNLVTSNFFSGNGSLLTGLAGGNVTGQVANALIAGTVYANAQPNITSVGTLTSTTLAANSNIALSGSLSQISGANNLSGTYLTGTLTTASQPNVTSIGTLSSLTVTGLLTATGTGLKASNIQDSTGTVTIQTGYNSNAGDVGIYGNLTVGTSGTGNLIATNLTGTLVTGAQPNITSTGTLSSLNVTGNITSGNANLGNLITANFVDGTLTTNAQPNITSVGTLSNLTVTANISSGNANLGNLVTSNFFIGNGSLLTGITGTYSNSNVANYLPTYSGNVDSLTITGNLNFQGANAYFANLSNVKIPGGSANYVIKTDGSGNLSWTAQTGGGGGGGLTFTAANTPPGSPNLGDQWYNTSTSVLYEYISDGGNFWIDIQTPTTTGASSSTYVSRTYTANGTGTTYTVTSGSNVNNLLVFLNGISQQPTVDYTVSGSTLTFDSAPANGTIVFIRELSTPQATTISQLLGNLTVTSSLTTGNLTANGTVTLGSISNVKITGGSSGQVVQTDGTGNLSFSSPTTRAVAMTMGIIFGG